MWSVRKAMSAIRRNSVQIQQHILFRGPKKEFRLQISTSWQIQNPKQYFLIYIFQTWCEKTVVWKHINIMGKHIILMVCTDMYILFSNVMQRESRWLHRSVLTGMPVRRALLRETVLMQKQLIMDGTQITAQLDRLWKQCLHIWERSLEKITVI